MNAFIFGKYCICKFIKVYQKTIVKVKNLTPFIFKPFQFTFNYQLFLITFGFIVVAAIEWFQTMAWAVFPAWPMILD